jgi:hypothetical protein
MSIFMKMHPHEVGRQRDGAAYLWPVHAFLGMAFVLPHPHREITADFAQPFGQIDGIVMKDIAAAGRTARCR